MNAIRRNLRVNERLGVGTRDAPQGTAALLMEIATDIGRYLRSAPIDLGNVSNGVTTFLGKALDSLQPEQRAKVLDNVFESMQGSVGLENNGNGFHVPVKDASLRQKRDATGRVCDAINKANEQFWAKKRGI